MRSGTLLTRLSLNHRELIKPPMWRLEGRCNFARLPNFSVCSSSMRLLSVASVILMAACCHLEAKEATMGSSGVSDLVNLEGTSLSPEQISDVMKARSAPVPEQQVAEEPQELGQPSARIVEVPVEEGVSAIERLLSGGVSSALSTSLTQFGYDVFRGSVTTFAPVTDVPVGPDYIVGPGDSFSVTLWGRVNAQYPATVNRNGEIVLPEIGVLKVWGMTFAELKDHLQREFSRKHTDYKMVVTMERLRTVRVFVVGEVRTPGSYTLSSLSTVINALFAAGGPSKNGTLRRIRLLRSQSPTATVDLYDFLLGGDKSNDLRLENGDTIFIPLIGAVVGVAGNVKRPAIYEMPEPMTLSQVLDLAGGVTYAGWLQRVQVERVEDHQRRIVVDFDISGDGDVDGRKGASRTVLQDGDVVNVFSVSPLEQNVVNLEGHVARPGKYELKPGMRLGDLVSSYSMLLPQANMEYAEIERLVEPDYHPIVIPFNLRELLEGDAPENIELTRFDTVRIFRWDERITRGVFVLGAVHDPCEYRLVPGMKVSDLINAAGGLDKNAYLSNAEVTRRHISQGGMQTETIDINLEKALAGIPEHDIALQDYDHLVVRPIPELEFDRTATISGEVMFPGTYPLQRGETLSSLIERAGGYTNRAYLRGAVFTRESAKVIQQRRMDELTAQLEESVLTTTDRAVSGALDTETIESRRLALEAKKELLAKLRAAKVDGRVVVRLAPLDKLKGSEYDLELEKGDELVVPETPGVVHVVGEVFNPAALLYEQDRSVSYYLWKVGGPTKDADRKQLSVIRADGSVISMGQRRPRGVSWDSDYNQWSFGGSLMSAKLYPGDTVVVPRKMEKVPWLRTTKDITQILFQSAIAAGVVLAL